MRAKSFSLLFLVLLAATGTLPAQEPPPLPGGREPTVDNPVSPVKAEIAGYVRTRQDKRGAASIPVRLETNTGGLVAQAWTNNSGYFIFPKVACGFYVLAVDATGFRSIRQAVEHSYESHETVLYLVEDESQGAPAEDASVSVRQLQIPEPAQREYEKGLAASGKRKIEEAIARFRKAIELYPDYDEAYIQLSLAYLGQGGYGEAQQVLTQAVAVNENNAGTHALLGVALREQQRLPQSVEAFERSLRLQEASWFAHQELGETLVRMGRQEEALRHARRAHELNAVTPVTHLLLYKTLILCSEYAEALVELDEFLKLYPQHPLATRARQKRDALHKTLAQSAN